VGTGKLSKGLEWAMGGSGWGLRGEEEGAGVGGDGGGGARGPGQVKSRNKNEMERQGTSATLEPEKRERGGVHGRCHSGSEMAAAEPRDGVARAQEGQGGEARAALGLGSTRGEGRNWRWRRGVAKVEHMAGEAVLTPAAGVQRAKQRNRQRRKKREGGPRGLVGKTKTSGTSLKTENFPLIQGSDEKMVKIEVVELFKIYNFALGLKFRNLKYKVLFHHFVLKLIFT
jgi:hypothetical protein